MHGEIEILNLKGRPKYVILPGEFLVIGRSRSADIVLTNDPAMSRLHCKVFYHDKQFWIRNLKNTNYTLINDNIITDEKQLQHGDQIQIGHHKLKFFQVADAAEAVVQDPFGHVKRSDKLIGKIAVKLGLLTAERLKSAVKKQQEIAADGPYYPLEEILISENYLGPKDLEKIQEYKLNIPYHIPKYKLQELIGMGGMGHIYKGRNLKTAEWIACKIFSCNTPKYEQQMKDQFRREAEALLSFHHPNIVQGIEADEIEGTPYIIMEYVDGPTLQQHLKDCGGRLLPDEAVHIVMQVALALQHAHELGKIHRDIKPENILLTPEIDVKLCDFGLVRSTNDGETEENVFGTVAYMSPEQIKGMVVDIRSDIYSLGGVFYRLLFGKLPFHGDSRRIQKQHLAEEIAFPDESSSEQKADLARLIRRMMAKDPNDRYQTPQELIQDLQVLEGTLADGESDLKGTEELPRLDSTTKKAKPWLPEQPSRQYLLAKTAEHPINVQLWATAEYPREPKISKTAERTKPARNVGTASFLVGRLSNNPHVLGLSIVILVFLLATAISIGYWMTSEDRAYAKFARALQVQNLAELDAAARSFIQKYPQNPKVAYVQEQWQNMLFETAYRSPTENALVEARLVWNKIEAIDPNTEAARKTKTWLLQLEQEDQQRQEELFLTQQIAQIRQLMQQNDLTNAQESLTKYQARFEKSKLQPEFAAVCQELERQKILSQLKICRYYAADELSCTIAQGSNPNLPNKVNMASLLLAGDRPMLAKPLIFKGVFLVQNQDICYGVAVTDGRVLWQESLEGSGLYSWMLLTNKDQPTFENHLADKVFLARANSPEIKMLQLNTGKVLWHKILPNPLHLVPFFWQNDLILPSTDGNCYRISTQTGQLQGAWHSQEPIQAYTTDLEHNHLWFIAEQHAYQFDGKSGQLIGYLTWQGQAVFTGAIYGDHFFMIAQQKDQIAVHKFNVLDSGIIRPIAKTVFIPGKLSKALLLEPNKLGLLVGTDILAIALQDLTYQHWNISQSQAAAASAILTKTKELILLDQGIASIPWPIANASKPSKIQFPKIAFPGTPALNWQTIGNVYAVTTVQNQTTWLHVFYITQQKKQLLWQRRFGASVYELLALEREKMLWLSQADGSLMQIVPTSKPLQPTLRIQRGSLYDDVRMQMLYIPQESNPARLLILSTLGASRLLQASSGQSVKDWNLREKLDNTLVPGLTHAQSKVVFLMQANQIKTLSLVSGRALPEPILGKERFTMPLQYSNGMLLTGDSSANLDAWQVVLQPNSVKFQKTWTFAAQAGLSSTPLITSKAIYLGDNKGMFYSIHPKTGKAIWQCSLGAKIQAPAILAEPVLLATTGDGNVFCIETATGKIRWQQQVAGPILAKPILARTKVYIATTTGMIIALSSQTGTILWQIKTKGGIQNAFAQLDNKIYAGTDTGWLHIIQDTNP